MNFIDVSDIFEKQPGYKFSVPGVRLPKIIIPEEDRKELNLPEDASNYDFLRALARKGFKKLNLKKGTKKYDEYLNRAKYELELLEELSFTDYVLLCWDIINWCKKEKIAVGLGRGSVAGSLLMYLIGVTGIDSVKHGLYFERFVSRARARKVVIDGVTYLDGSLVPDVDLDFEVVHRQRVVDYLKEKYNGNICGIMQFNTLSGKLVIKECGKVVANKSETEVQEAASHIERIFGKVQDLESAYKKDEAFKSWVDQNKEVFDISLKLRDLIKNKSSHPSGTLISFDPLCDTIATETVKQKVEEGEVDTGERKLVCSADMNTASLVAIKVDLLGLKNLSVVRETCDQLGIQMESIDVEDPFIYQQLQDLKYPKGLFQIEAKTNYQVARKVKPKNLEELSAVLGLARPGALAYVDQYALYTNHGTYTPINPIIDDVLEKTGGVCIYQETVMQLFTKIGFSLTDAETIRRVIGKKKSEEVLTWKDKIYEKCAENKIDKTVGDLIWKICSDSASYQFNRSHSAAYATLSAITIYLKYKHPKNFFLSLLNASKHDPNTLEKIGDIAEELPHFGIRLLPPDLNRSQRDFTIEGNDIRFGLLYIKGIQLSTLEKFDKFKKDNKNKFELFASLKEAKISIGVVSSLIQAGAIQELKDKRSFFVLEAQLWNILSDNERKLALEYGDQFSFNLIKTVKFLSEKINEKGKKVIPERRYGTIKKKYELYKEIYEKNSSNEKFANWFYEKKLMGYSSNVTLKDVFQEKHSNLLTVNQAMEMAAGQVKIVAQVSDKYLGTSRKGDKYLRLTIRDDSGTATCLAFKETVDEIKVINGDKFPSEDNIIIVNGKRSRDVIFIDHLAIQDSKIYIKLGELKDDKKEEENDGENKNTLPL